MRQSTYSKLRSMLLALCAVAAVAAVAVPAHAENRHEDRRGHDGHWRGHRDWDRGGVYVAPSYGYYNYGYPPPPPVYYPQPGFSINIPLDIH